MNLKISPSELSGKIIAPSSKSVFQRLVVCALLAEGKTTIDNISHCNDAVSALKMAKTLGANYSIDKNTVIIEGGGKLKSNIINAGESGLGIRLFTSIASLQNQPITINGEGSLQTRPMKEFESILTQVGVKVTTNNGLLPITVKGKMQGGLIKMNANLSSQFLSGLLMALPVCENDSRIEVENLKSVPYIQMTIEVLNQFGITIEHDNFKTFTIKGSQKYKACKIQCPGDWSGAAGLFVSGAVGATNGIEISGLYSNYFQADQRIVKLFEDIGITIKQKSHSYKIIKSSFPGFRFNATHCPDLFPVLASLAAFGDYESSIIGVNRLKHKESDRGLAIQKELAKAGIKVKLNGDEMIIFPSTINSCTIDSHNDHRIVMMATILGLSGAEIKITNTECVDKSYPHFFYDIKKIGGKIKEVSFE